MPGIPQTTRFPLLAALVLGALTLLPPVVAGDAAAPGEPEGAILRLRVFADAEGRDRLAASGHDIAGHALSEGWVEVITGPSGAERLREEGFRIEILEARTGTRPLGGEGGEGGPDVPLPDTLYHDPAEIETFLQQAAADHPSITRLEGLGSSTDGRTLWAMLVSDNASVDEDELSILLNGNHHAREVMTPEVILDALDYLTDNYGTDPQVTRLVDAHQIWLVPTVNPDGLARVHEVDDFWRKNTRDNDSNGTINSSDGVDLNRNYEWGWGYQCQGSSGSISSATYRGPGEGSEPEAQAMIALGRRIRPVFDVEYHSYGEDVFYALSCDPTFSPELSTIADADKSISRVIAEGYAAEIVQADGGLGFSAAPYGSRVDGTGRDQQYHENGSIAFVTEINSSLEGGFHPDYETWRDATVEGQRPGWLWLMERMTGPAVGGHVTDALSGLPVEAEVSLDEMSLPDNKLLTSRPDTGRFHLIVVPGEYTLRVRATGYREAVVPLSVGGEFVPTAVALEPLGSGLIHREDFEDPARAALWTVGGPDDTASSGIWVWGEPEGTHEGTVQGTLRFGNARFDRSGGEGHRAFVTGNLAAAGFADDDVDTGLTTLLSPLYDLSGFYGVELSWQRWFRKEPSELSDYLEAEVSADGLSWVSLERLETATFTADAAPAWTGTSRRLDELIPLGPAVRFRFRAADLPPDHVVEAALDEVVIRGYSLDIEGEVSGLRVSGEEATVLDWNPVPGGEGALFDVERGELLSLGGGPAGVNLGPLSCIEDGSPDTSTSGDPDLETPAPGTGRFYLVRFELGFSRGGYGRGSEGGTRSGSAGCSP